MGANLILPFAQSGGAAVLSQADYAADAQRPIGNQPGVARGVLVNKALKQTSAIAAGIAQWLADNQPADVTDDLLVAALSTMFTNAARAAAGLPAGSVIWVPGDTPLAGTVALNGALLSRTTYSRLFTWANTSSNNMAATDGAWTAGQFSPGDGATTFRVPKAGGYFFRALDAGAGIDPGRAVGSIQLDRLKAHLHSFNVSTSVQNAVALYLGYSSGAGTSGTGVTRGVQTVQATTEALDQAISNVPAHSHTVSGNTGSTGDTETAPKNIAWLPVIYF